MCFFSITLVEEWVWFFCKDTLGCKAMTSRFDPTTSAVSNYNVTTINLTFASYLTLVLDH